MKKIIIFGVTNKAQELKYYIEAETAAEVCAFTVDKLYKNQDKLMGLPVIEFDKLTTMYPSQEYEILICIGYSKMNRNRETKYNECKKLGYGIFTFVSSKANIYAQEIGEGCMILPGATISPFVTLGNCNFVDNAVTICHNTKLGNFNYIAPSATICGEVNLGNNCFIGAKSTICSGVFVDNYTLIAAGAVISKNTEEKQVIFPARSTLYHGTSDDINL